MRPFSPRMFPHRAHFLPTGDSTDSTGSAVETPPDPGSALPCWVGFKGSRARMAGDREVGVTLADLAFPADPGCGVGDFFEQVGAGRRFRALAPAQALGADGVLFVVACEAID
jgi:hypothetical protein